MYYKFFGDYPKLTDKYDKTFVFLLLKNPDGFTSSFLYIRLGHLIFIDGKTFYM